MIKTLKNYTIVKATRNVLAHIRAEKMMLLHMASRVSNMLHHIIKLLAMLCNAFVKRKHLKNNCYKVHKSKKNKILTKEITFAIFH